MKVRILWWTAVVSTRGRAARWLLALGMACLATAPAAAGLAADVKEIFDETTGLKVKTNTINGQTSGLKARTEEIRTDVQDLAAEFRGRRQEISPEVRDQFSAAQDLFQSQIQEEQLGAQAWIDDGGCAVFYGNLQDLMSELKTLDDELLGFAFEPDCAEEATAFFTPDVGLELPGPSPGTCKLLYPMYTALVTAENLGLNVQKTVDFVQCMSNGVTELVAFARLDTSDPDGVACQELMNARWNLRGLTRRMTKGSIALDTFGSALEKRSKGKDVNVAIWGWVGFTLKFEPLNKIAARSKSASSGLTKIADYVNEKLEGCEREEILNRIEPQPLQRTDSSRKSMGVMVR